MFVESALSSILKPAALRLDLSKISAVNNLTQTETSAANTAGLHTGLLAYSGSAWAATLRLDGM